MTPQPGTLAVAFALSLASGAPMSHARADVPPAAAVRENRLARESSPYLRQHARNPVDWFPWGEEAFDEARRRQVPIFLSIGYSTCYWCHVMERESFEDQATADLLNAAFVCVKVDREERPDVDDIYMNAVQAMTGRGGWPMSVWLTPPPPENAGDDAPGLRPFYAGTYFPPEPRHGMASFRQVIVNITEAWRDSRADVHDQAARVTDAIREQTRWEPTAKVTSLQIGQAISTLLRIHDTTHGGFGRAPKFPQPVYLDFLMELEGRINDPAIASALTSSLRLTLDKMALGGMYDHLGGGFHRYSTDESWTVPHFEKMLYDNAMLASAYARAYARSRDPFDANIVRGILAYAQRELRDPETNSFRSAQDAEVDGKEGLNYLWTRDEFTQVLGDGGGDAGGDAGGEAEFAAKLFGLDKGTNFHDPHHPEEPRRNVLVMPMRPEAFAKEMGIEPNAFGERWSSVQRRLLEARTQRKQPHLDDKAITSWNGLMIGALADAALALNDLAYLDQAEKTSRFFLVNMRTPSGGVFRTYRDTKAKIAGFLEDYAYLVQGLIKVHLANAASGRADTRYLVGAEELTKIALERFAPPSPPAAGTHDVHPGTLFDTRDAQADLIVRSASTHDGAMPSAQGVMLHNLIDLYLITRNETYRERAVQLAQALSGEIARSPVATINSTRAALRLLTIKPDAFEGLPDAPANATSSAASDGAEVDTDPVVQIHATTDRLLIPKQGESPVTLTLKLTIDEGFHINAREPNITGMTGLAIRAVGGTGLHVDFTEPAPKPYTGGALPEGEGPLMVHQGEVELTVTLSRTAEPWEGRPILELTYQACDDRACLRPQAVTIDVALDPAP
ncbi:MAG: DUF255 domain-containing protein [Phycisphaerales bacterium]